MIRPQRLELPWQEPQALAQQLAHAYGEEGLVWLDGDGSNLGRWATLAVACLLYTSPSPRDTERSRMPSSA